LNVDEEEESASLRSLLKNAGSKLEVRSLKCTDSGHGFGLCASNARSLALKATS